MDSSNKSILRLNTSMGSSSVWITKVEGQEGFSELFSYKLHLATQQPIRDIYNYIGTLISFSILETEEQNGRDFNGLLISFYTTGEDSITGWYYYEIELVPWLWLLTQRNNCRIFPGNGQRKMITVKQVLEELFQDYSAFQVDLSGIKNATITSDFWLQYNETDFNFFSRLVETYGIFYYFSQSQDQHKLILADQKQSYSSQIHPAYRFYSTGGGQAQITSWKHNYRFVPKAWTYNSHNSDQPATQLQAKSESCITHKRMGPAGHYTYTFNYLQRDQGETLAQMRMEEEEAQSTVVEASSTIISLATADHLQLDKTLFPQETEYDFIITQLIFLAEDARISDGNAKAPYYENRFYCIPATQTYRPRKTAHKPHGNQLHEAVVTGVDNEEIYTDELHRLRVQFVWDTAGKNDANSSCWIRTVSAWEGVLRIGTPVLVGFFNNNIDQPVILGPMYDGQQKPLFPEKTMSGLKRRPGSHGDDSYYNELRFNDKKDQAEVYLHACKDMQVDIDNNLSTTVKNNNTLTIDQSRKTVINKGSDTLTLNQGDLTITVSQGKCEITIQGDVTIKSNANLTLNAAQTLTLSADTLHVNAQTTLTQKAASVTVQASDTLSLNGNTEVTIKGTSIQLN